MSDTSSDLSARYYIAEASLWVLAGILIVGQFVGLAPGQPLPLLNVTPEDSQLFPRVVAALLGAAVLYVVFEWKQSSQTARASRWVQARFAGTVLWACASFWLSYSLIARGTRFAAVSPAWYLGFASIGFFLGTFVAWLAFSSLMIRTAEEARRLRLPRIPAATRAQFITVTPVVVLLIVVYRVLLHLSPEAIHELAVLLVVVPFLAMIGQELASLYFAHDERGQTIPYAKRIARFKEIHDSHDYSYLLIDTGPKAVHDLEIPMESPQAIQKAMRQRFSVDDTANPAHPHVQQGEDTGRPLLHSAVERGHETKVRELLTQNVDVNERAEAGWTALLYALAQGYPRIARLLLEAGANPDISNVHNITPLMYSARYGNEEVCKLLINYGADLNLQDVYGETALMVAARTGHRKIAKLLITAGAEMGIRNSQEQSALDLAHLCKQGAIAKILRRSAKNRLAH